METRDVVIFSLQGCSGLFSGAENALLGSSANLSLQLHLLQELICLLKGGTKGQTI